MLPTTSNARKPIAKWLLFLIISFSGITTIAQDLTVPDEILEKLTTEVIYTETDTFTFRVAYPDNYNAEKEYDCFIGLSGGTQSMQIVDYCYAAWFQSGYFNEHITILPVNTGSDTISLLDYEKGRIQNMVTAIQENFPVRSDWVIAGTSNGGIGAFEWVAMDPLRYKAIIVAPGFIEPEMEIGESWEHLDVILAYGDRDDPIWIKRSKQTAKRLKKAVKSVQLVALKDQGHILKISFNVDKFYDPYFLMDR